MDLSVIAGIIMNAAVELSGLSLEESMKPEIVVMSKQELAADLCIPGKEYQCNGYKTFSPPFTNKIILSSELKPETSISDQSIIFHENLKYLLFANAKVAPVDSCEKVYAMEARIFKLQLNFIATQMARGETGETFNADEIMKMDKGSFVNWCNPNKRDTEPKYTPKEVKPTIFIPVDEWNDSMVTLKNAKYWMSLKNTGILPITLNLMVVLQGKTFNEMELLYQQCVDLGYRHFAFNHSSISYQNEIESDDKELTKSKIGRIELIRRLWNKNIIKQHHWIHLLGASDITEFSYYKQALPGIISSVDTSSPIIKAIEEGLYTEENMRTKSLNKMKKYFEDSFDSELEIRILNNIKKFKKLIQK